MKVTEVRRCNAEGWKDTDERLGMESYTGQVAAIMKKVHSFVLIYWADGGVAEAKAMSLKDNDGVASIWFVTHRSSKHANNLERNPTVTLYFNDIQAWEGLMLVGNVVEEHDNVQKEKCWRPFYEATFTQGIYDPEYLVFRFDTEYGNFSGPDGNFTFIARC